jgi:hypothetical protein
MDQLVFFALFVLFSAVSALLERRKRRQSLEEARRRHEAAAKQPSAPAPAGKEDMEDEEEMGKWPWPEIFEQAPPRPRRVKAERAPAEVLSTEAAAAETQAGEGKYRRAEEELREIELRVQEMDQRAREAERRSLEEYHLMEAQAAARMGGGAGSRRPARAPEGGSTAPQGWGLTPREARRAFVYAEIFGPPKCERRE